MTFAAASIAQMPNVFFDPDATKNGTPTSVGFSARILHEVMSKLAIEKPLWRFMLIGAIGGDNRMMCRAVRLFCNGEDLGHITTEYFRSNYCVSIHSHRVSTNRGKQRTSDVDKAMSICRKVFAPRNVNERLEQADHIADRAVSSAMYEFQNAKNRAYREFNDHAFGFALVQHEAAFIEYLRRVEPKAVQQVSKYKEAELNHLTVQKMRDQMNTGITALVVLDNDKYIVRQQDVVQLYDDTTLPEHLRGKLGMLKLVEEGQVISDIGCRAAAEVFVIALETLPTI